jgi:hypothetical protein
LFGFNFQASYCSSLQKDSPSSPSPSLKDEEQIKKCLELGFNPQTLSCSICSKMNQIVNDESLTQECQNCCSEEGLDAYETYELIVLEIDKNFLKQNEELSKFLKGIGNQIVLRHKYLMSPTLLMYQERNDLEPSRRINIASWSLEEIQEFLKSHSTEE